MSDITTTLAWKMGRNGEQRGDTMGPFEDGTLADVQWRAGFDALADSVVLSDETCPTDTDGLEVACSHCPFITPHCDDPDSARHQ
jgi:hypothetical protein